MASHIAPAPPANASWRTDWNSGVTRHHLTLLARVAQATASAVIITDDDDVMVWVNEGFSRITGYSFDEAVGRKPGQLLQGPDTDRGEIARIGAALRARQSVSAELLNYAKDGRRYWIGMKIEPLFAANGEFDGFMAIEADITNRREEYRAIQQLTRRFDLATKSAGVGVFERDSNGDIVWWSDVMWEIFGLQPASSTLSNELWMQMIHPDDRERMRRKAAGLAKCSESYDWQYRIIRPDGKIRHVQAIGAPERPRDDAAQHISGITIDITERVLASEREKALQIQLRQSSHQAGMAEIVTGVLHNVGNVLNSLVIANSTAQRDLKGLRVERLEKASSLLHSHRADLAKYLADDERGRHLPDYLAALSADMVSYARTIQSELDTIEQLLRHLSDIVSAQQDLAHVGGRRELVDIKELMEAALLVQAPELAHIEIVREYREVPPVLIDRHKILQILVNLIGNARDAIHASASKTSRIVVRVSSDDQDHALLVVEDSGSGMSEKVLAQLWQFGFTTKKNGHGFGLHNSANAAHAMGATLTARSDGPNCGSRFTLRVPLNNSETTLSGVTE